MRLIVIEGSKEVFVTVSKRNLLALLSKLDRPDSHCCLTKEEDDDWLLRLEAESDEEHYGTRSYPPGPMVDFTEQDIVRLEREVMQ